VLCYWGRNGALCYLGALSCILFLIK
jgi:hypothetical protein